MAERPIAGVGFATIGEHPDLSGLDRALGRIEDVGATHAELALFAADLLANGRILPGPRRRLEAICARRQLRYTAHGGVLIACRTLPGSVNRGLVIYASLRDEDVVGINSVFHGPNDWVIARRVGKKFEVVKTGDFPKGPSGPWNANVAW